MDPATIALLLKAMLTAIPSLIEQYNIAKGKDNFTAEERAELDAMIQDFKNDPANQE